MLCLKRACIIDNVRMHARALMRVDSSKRCYQVSGRNVCMVNIATNIDLLAGTKAADAKWTTALGHDDAPTFFSNYQRQ